MIDVQSEIDAACAAGMFVVAVDDGIRPLSFTTHISLDEAQARLAKQQGLNFRGNNVVLYEPTRIA